jgi:hypothetical protein
MMTTKLAVLKALKAMPLIRKWAGLAYYSELLTQVEQIEARFFSATVRFTDNMHLLYDCLLQATDVALEEDFAWFQTVAMNTYTKTSGEAHSLLAGLLEGKFLKVEDYFKEYEVRKMTGLLHWYSSSYTVESFMATGLSIIGIYCEHNPHSNDEDGEDIFTKKPLRLNQPLAAFITSRHFRLMVDDLLTVTRLAISSQIRVLDGEAKEAVAG